MKSKYLIVGIAGGTASGKTSLIRKLIEEFSDQDISLISQDNYYKTKNEIPKDANGNHNFDLPEGIDFQKLLKDIQTLKNGHEVYVEEYQFNKPEERKLICIKPSPIIIVEGILIFCNEILEETFDFKIFIQADLDIMLSRRIERDKIERGYSLEEVLYMWNEHVIPSYSRLIEPQMKRMDIIINNNQSFQQGLRILVGFLKSELTNRLLNG